MLSQTLKVQAIALRKQGASLLQISKKLHIAKSTASLWLRTVENRGLYSTLTKKEWMNHILNLAHESVKQRIAKKELQQKQSAKIFINKLPETQEVKKAIVSLLYWAEGTKVYGGVTFANTDPRLCLLFITTLRSCFNVDEKKFRIRLHFQHHHQEELEKIYWSNLLNIPLNQFNKTVWKQTANTGKRFRKNYHGICFVKYNSVDLQQEIMAYAYALGAKFTEHSLGL